MPPDNDQTTGPQTSTGNGRWRGNVEADIKNILRLVEHSGQNIGKLFDEVHDMAQRVRAVEVQAAAVDATMPNVALKKDVTTSIENHAKHETRNTILSGGGGSLFGAGGGIAAYELIKQLFF